MGTSIVFILSYRVQGDGYDTHIVHPTSQGLQALHKHLAILRAVELVHVLWYRVCATPPYCFFNMWRWPIFSSPLMSGSHIQSVSSPIFHLRRVSSVQSLYGSQSGSLGYDVCFVVRFLGFFSVKNIVAVNKLVLSLRVEINSWVSLNP